MKRTIKLVIYANCVFIAVLFLTLMCGIKKTAYAATGQYTNEYGTWNYSTLYDNNSLIKITGFVSSDYSPYITIPTQMDGLTVTEIGENVFKDQIGIYSVTMPNTVTAIADFAFKGCNDLTSVTLSTNLTEIPYRAFAGCAKLTGVNGLQKNTVMKKIGYEAFYNCSALTSINIPNSINNIEAHAFYGCTKLEYFCFPTQIKQIKSISGSYDHYSVLYGCVNLKSVFVPSGVTEIDDDAFDINGTDMYVPKIYGLIGSYAQTYASLHGITFQSLDNTLNNILYDLSIEKGFIIMPNGNQKTSVTGAVVGEEYPITVDTTKITPGYRFSHWEKTIEITAKHNSLMHYPYNNTSEYRENTFTVETPEEAVKMLMDDIIKNDSSAGYYTFSGSIIFSPVYKLNKDYNITVTNGTANKQTAKEDDEVTVTADEIIGKEFSYWEATGFDKITDFTQRFNSQATFTMPGSDVTLTAKYTNRDKHAVSVSVINRNGDSLNNNNPYATVTLDKTSAYYNETITGSITLNTAAGSYSIEKTASKVNNSTINWIDDTHFSFVMPDLKATVTIYINVFVILTIEKGSSYRTQIFMKTNNQKYTFTDNVRYNCFIEILDYLKAQGKADYSVSGTVMSIDMDGDGNDDFTLDTSSKEATCLETTSIAPEWNYKMDETALNVIRDNLAAKDQWLLYDELSILSPYLFNPIDAGKQTIDISAGSYKLKEDKDFGFMTLLSAKTLQGLITGKTSDNIIYLDIDNDGSFDLSYDETTKDGFKVMDTTSIFGTYSLNVSDKELEFIKKQCQDEGYKEYYSAYDIIFPEKYIPTPAPTPASSGSDPSKSGSASPAPGDESGNNSGTVLPIADYDENIPLESAEAVIVSSNTDKKDIVGSKYYVLGLKASTKKNSIKLTWNKVGGADGYIIYGAECGKKLKKIAEVKGSGSKSFKVKKLKKGKFYKYVVTAYRETADGKRVISTSLSVHAITDGGKMGNPSAVKVNKTKISINAGKKTSIKAKLSSKKKLKIHIAKFRYESEDESIATVSKKGVIKGVSAGKTNVYVIAQNGVFKKIEVEVK